MWAGLGGGGGVWVAGAAAAYMLPRDVGEAQVNGLQGASDELGRVHRRVARHVQ